MRWILFSYLWVLIYFILASKRRKGEKGSKGLRHFSMKVCEKVQQKGTTSYNEVADELVSEFTDLRSQSMTDQVIASLGFTPLVN